jgi:hypothetical protein
MAAKRLKRHKKSPDSESGLRFLRFFAAKLPCGLRVGHCREKALKAQRDHAQPTKELTTDYTDYTDKHDRLSEFFLFLPIRVIRVTRGKNLRSWLTGRAGWGKLPAWREKTILA